MEKQRTLGPFNLKPVCVVDGEVVVELPHEQQLVVENDVCGPLFVTLDVGHELLNGDVELLDFAGQVDGRD